MEELVLWKLGILLLAGGLAGFINAVAGSGSLLTIPALMFLGLPADVANGTNRLGILSQAIAAVLGYRRGGVSLYPRSLVLLLPALLGAVLGSCVAVQLPEAVMHVALTVVLVAMIGIMFIDPKRWATTTPPSSQPHRRPLLWGLLFAIGAYAGFIQVGTGFFLLFALLLVGGMDLLQGNILKNLFQMVLQLAALPVYLLGGKINWTAGLVLAMGMAIGAWCGSRLAAKRGVRFLRIVLIVAVLLFAARQVLEWWNIAL